MIGQLSGQLRRRVGFWILAAVLAAFLAGASVPSPLYGVYAAAWHFSALMITVIFAVYALALLVTLLTSGRLSDSLGRRPVILAALTAQAVSMVLFLLANGLVLLFCARILQGMATGLMTAAVSAALLDLQPPEGPGRGPLMNAVMPTLGLAVGALLAGVLVQYEPSPMRLVYLVMLIIYVALGAAVISVPETVTSRTALDLRPRLSVHPSLRGSFLSALPCLIACWALGGLYLSLGPTVVLQVVGSSNHLVGGSMVFALCAAGALSCVLLQNLAPQRMMTLGCGLLIIGLLATIVAIAVAYGAGLVISSVVAGAGFGAGFLGAFRHLVATAQPQWRAGLITAIYLVAYLAFALPAVIAGVAVNLTGLRPTTIVYAAVVLLLAVTSLVSERIRSRASKTSQIAVDQ